MAHNYSYSCILHWCSICWRLRIIQSLIIIIIIIYAWPLGALVEFPSGGNYQRPHDPKEYGKKQAATLKSTSLAIYTKTHYSTYYMDTEMFVCANQLLVVSPFIRIIWRELKGMYILGTYI